MIKNRIKLIAFDLDGTLLNENKKVSIENRRVLEECGQMGIQLVPCTGRTIQGIPEEVLGIPGVHYAITVNGGKIVDKTTGKVIESRMFSPEQAVNVIDIAKEYPVMYDAYINGRGISDRSFLKHLEDYGITGVLADFVRSVRDPVENVREYVVREKKPVEKLNIFFRDLSCREELRTRIRSLGYTVVSSSTDFNLEINAEGATKGDAILSLASYLGISPDETMAFGDGENDITMIEKAGIGIAMGNAGEFLNVRADYITLTNEENGIADAVRHLILEQKQ